MILAAVLIAVVAAAGAFIFWKALFPSQLYYTGITAEAKMEKVQLRIVSRGEVESASNSDIKCKVKTNDKQRGSVKIKWVIEDGTQVKKGRKVIELDSTPLQDELRSQEIAVDTAYALYKLAEKDYRVVDYENKALIKKAEGDYYVAKLELEKYKKGDYIIAMTDLDKQIYDAQSSLKQWQEKASWSRRMSYYGYVTDSQVFSDNANKKSAEILLDNLTKQRSILDDFTKKKMQKELEVKRDVAFLTWKKEEKSAKLTKDQREADYKAKKSIWIQELAKKEEIESEIKKCIITAPRDGLVIYHLPEQSRFGRGTNQSMIAEGEPVTYDQKLMQVPDLTDMQVKCRIHEAMVKYLDTSERKLPATVRVSAFPKRLFRAHVKSVATVASKADFLSSDVRVYETVVSIDEELEERSLKPGMSAEVSIVAYETPKPVLTIPIQGVVGNITMNEKRKCYVIHEDGTAEMRDIVIGMSNERIVEVKSGLEPGEKVALDPNSLLPSDSSLHGAKPPQSYNRRSGGKYKKGGKGGKGGKFKKSGNGSPRGKGAPGAKQTSKRNAGQGEFSKEKMGQLADSMKKMTPQQRREKLEQLPADRRKQVEQFMESKGLSVAD